MATSVPERPYFDYQHGGRAEEQVWQWAVDELASDVIVLPHVHTFEPRHQPVTREFDLVIVDPRHGLTLIEVKAGRIEHRSGTWFMNGEANPHGRPFNPVKQVEDAWHRLRRVLEGAGLGRPPASLALAFPDSHFATRSPSIPQVFDRRCRDKGGFRERYETMWANQQARRGGSIDYSRLVEVLRGWQAGETYTTRDKLAQHDADVASEAREVRENYRNRLLQMNCAVVMGPAGTGKTQLAVVTAASLAAANPSDRILLTSYNIVLGRELSRALRNELIATGANKIAGEVTEDPEGRVVVGPINSFDAQASAPPVGLDDVARDRWWRDVPPTLIRHELFAGGFNVVVVDEWQSFPVSYRKAVRALAEPRGRFYAFADPTQDLFGHGAVELPGCEPLFLRENFRMTREIATFAASIAPSSGVDDDVVERRPGEPVEFVAARQDAVHNAAPWVAKELMAEHGYRPEDIAVLYLDWNPMRSSKDELHERLRTGDLVESSVAAFTGLERAVVVLGLDTRPATSADAEAVVNLVYAGATRARYHLVVVGDQSFGQATELPRLQSALAKAKPAPEDVQALPRRDSPPPPTTGNVGSCRIVGSPHNRDAR